MLYYFLTNIIKMSSIVDMIFTKKSINPINLNKPLGKQMVEPIEKKKTFEELLGRKKPREAVTRAVELGHPKKPMNLPMVTKSTEQVRTNVPPLKTPVKPFMDKKEKQLMDKLKNYESINDLFNVIDTSKDEVNKLFPKQTQTIEERAKQYIPKSENEIKALRRIEEANKLQEKLDIKKVTKVIRNKKSDGPEQSVRMESDIYCSKCKKYHDPDFHKKTRFVNEDKYFKPVGGKTGSSFSHSKPKENKMAEIKKTITKAPIPPAKSTAPVTNHKPKSAAIPEKPKQFIIPKKAPEVVKQIQKRDIVTPAINNGHSSVNKINMIKQSIAKPVSAGKANHKNLPKPNGVFSAHDFEEEEDDFIVDDDDTEYRRYMKGINRQFTRRNFSPEYYSEDDDIGEAGFDMIMDEEAYTARRGEEEDYVEELREEELKRLKKKKNK
jgi:hypothetical protein